MILLATPGGQENKVAAGVNPAALDALVGAWLRR